MICIAALRGYTLTTGRFLAHELGVDLVTDGTRNEYDMVIRWGSRYHIPSRRTINPEHAIRVASNKRLALSTLQDAGIPIPQTLFSLSVERVQSMIPCCLRTTYHQGGRGLVVVESDGDLDGVALGDFSHATKLINKTDEWRVHTGEVGEARLLFVQRKLRQPETPSTHIWNFKHGYTFNYRHWSDVPESVLRVGDAAREVLGLHFGAVDVIRNRDGQVFVLEVNTAPGLTVETSQNHYIKFFREIIACVD